MGVAKRLAALAVAFLALPASAAAAQISVFPIPGSRLATPRTQITFRHISPASIGTVAVTGSRSGVHGGHWTADSDGQGASFYPTQPFHPGEVVTVHTALSITGASGGSFKFRIERPDGRVPPAPPLAAARVRGDVDRFHSRPGLHPAAVRIRRAYTGASDIFLTSMRGPTQWGPMILDRWGHLVWFDRLGSISVASDLRVQQFRGQPVLTWWQGFVYRGFGQGEDVIYDQHYQPVATVHAGNGLSADLHEFALTPQGTALITSFSPVHWNGSSLHTRADLDVLNCTVQEIDIRTGNVLFQWDSLDHVPLTASYADVPKQAHIPYDYFHINSVQQDADGNLVVSARNTWAVYKIDRRSAATIWTLGGKHPSFRMGAGTQTAYQHDATIHPGGLVTLFDDGAAPAVHPQSRVVLERINPKAHTARLIRALDHSPSLLSSFEGSAQLLPNDHVFVGWGEQPYFTEFDRRGRQIFDGRFVGPLTSYRAYEFAWHGQPLGPPAAAVLRGADGTSTVYGSWNGATDVVRWRVLAGQTPNSLSPVHSTWAHGFETAIRAHTEAPYVAVQALSGTDQVLGTSPAVGSRRARVSIFGRNAFVSPTGFGGLRVACFADADCQLSGSLSAGHTKIGYVRKQVVPANSGGGVVFRLTPHGRTLLAHSRSNRLKVTAGLRNAGGAAAFSHVLLVPYQTTGRRIKHTFQQSASIRILAGTAFISRSGAGGVFAQCLIATACQVNLEVRVRGTVVASASGQSIPAQDCGMAFFRLTARGARMLSQNRGNHIPAQLSISQGDQAATAQISLVGY